MRNEFNHLVELMNRYDLYQKDDEVGDALNDLEKVITELEKRIECVTRCNKEIDEVVFSFVDAFHDRDEETQPLTCNQFEVLLRGIHDIDIALDLKETECIDNNWYGLFEEPKEEVEDKFKPRSVAEYVATLPKEEPPTSLCKTPQTHEFVKDIIAKLKVIDVDGETMQYILEQVGMEEQMLKQLIKSCEHLEQVEEIIDEARSIK